MLQNYAISAKPVPSEDDTKRALDERIGRLALNIPGMNYNSSQLSKELEPFVQQYHRISQLIKRGKLIGDDDEIRLLELNLREIEREMSIVKQSF
jgi:hypothetical protein